MVAPRKGLLGGVLDAFAARMPVDLDGDFVSPRGMQIVDVDGIQHRVTVDESSEPRRWLTPKAPR